MDKAEELKKEFIEDYSPHFRREPMYPVELNENKIFRKRLNQLLEQYAQQITKEKDLEIEVLNQALKKIAGI
jgi:hypothetical protein